MIKVENIDVWGWDHAIRAMRNPLNSWDKSDSYHNYSIEYRENGEEIHHPYYRIGANDLALMQKLYEAGIEHRTYARMIQAAMDITAPLYFWKEADRYAIGKTQISTSTMHTIHKKEFELDDFSCEHLENFDGYNNTAMFYEWFVDTIEKLNVARRLYIDTGDRRYWWQMIQLLPSSYNQKRTIMMSYEVIFKIIKERSSHKLDEWRDFVGILKKLPYIRMIMNEKSPEDEQVNGQINIEEYLKEKKNERSE